MASRSQDEDAVYRVVYSGLTRWLRKARDAVMAPWRAHKQQPDPTAVYQVRGDWDHEVTTIMTTIGKIALGAWSRATNVPPISRHAFMMSQLAQTENFLARMPDEVYHLIFAEITDGVNAGESIDQIAARVDQLLSDKSSENWSGRARNIAVTETTRALGAGTLAAGMEQSRLTGRLLRKRWDTEKDARVRATHRAVDGTTIDLGEPFMVGGFPLMFPADPAGPADEVCGCRCDLAIVNEGGQ